MNRSLLALRGLLSGRGILVVAWLFILIIELFLVIEGDILA